MITGFATREGTAHYAARFDGPKAAGFYREAAGCWVSSLGLGTYLGEIDDATDAAYSVSITEAVRSGVNLLDSAINYRHQRSERSVGAALGALLEAGELQRDEIVVSTKAGFLTTGATDPATLKPDEIVGRVHSMAPDFLSDQIDRSRNNLGLDTIDVFYLHNPETQLAQIDRLKFEERMHAAMKRLEMAVAEGRIRCYGTATWNGYRTGDADTRLDLDRVLEIARDASGEDHHFRIIQLPFNLAMTEAAVAADGRLPVLEVARKAGISVVGSATLLQGRLPANLPGSAGEAIPGLATAAQRAIQFARSVPGISSALVGMGNVEHLRENLGVAQVPPMDQEKCQGYWENTKL